MTNGTGERIGVVGLGYVGLPLAVALARKFDVVGFDVSVERVVALKAGDDWTNEISADELRDARLELVDDVAGLSQCTMFIVTVPTPIDAANRPDFGCLESACDLIGPILTKGSVIVFESTVYPGATEEICGPALEKASGLRCGTDFKLAYSPERINPGDKEHPIEKIIKVVSGQDAETLDRVDAVYSAIITAGTHRAASIKVAEAAKVIENTQRDVNIALMNEVSKICDLVGIRSVDVLEAAGTKWNFLKFHPGLVGGHCIGVDPYYLTAKAEQVGYHPEVILSGRRVNDSMGAYIGQRTVKLLAHADRPIRSARVGILGLTFKENVPDIRNSKVVDIVNELRQFGIEPKIHDPLADRETARGSCGVELCDIEQMRDLDVLIFAVPHDAYPAGDTDRWSAMLSEKGILIDIKSKLDPKALRQDILYWSL